MDISYGDHEIWKKREGFRAIALKLNSEILAKTASSQGYISWEEIAEVIERHEQCAFNAGAEAMRTHAITAIALAHDNSDYLLGVSIAQEAIRNLTIPAYGFKK